MNEGNAETKTLDKILTQAEKDYASATSETAKYVSLTQRYCYRADGQPGVGVDVASQGASVVPWAMNYDLPLDEFNYYCSNHPAKGPIQLRGHANKLPFDSASLDFLYCSHYLEDEIEWLPILQEWVRVLKPGGNLIILVPDKKLWNEALAKGQPPNCAHKHESYAGELSLYAHPLGLDVIEDRLTAIVPADYTVMFVGRRRA